MAVEQSRRVNEHAALRLHPPPAATIVSYSGAKNMTTRQATGGSSRRRQRRASAARTVGRLSLGLLQGCQPRLEIGILIVISCR